MLREMDFIEGDWAALFWALGGAKTLFRHLDAPMSNPSDVPSRTQALMKNSRRGALTIYACCFGMIVSFGWFIFIFPNPVQRIGSTLTAAAAVYLGCQVFERRNRKLPSEIQPSVCTAFYRTELERQRDFHRGSWLWSSLLILVPGYMLFLIGFGMAHPELQRGLAMIGACFIVFCIVGVLLNLRASRKYQRQIDELDSQGEQG